jgi:hypothetical protein
MIGAFSANDRSAWGMGEYGADRLGHPSPVVRRSNIEVLADIERLRVDLSGFDLVDQGRLFAHR